MIGPDATVTLDFALMRMAGMMDKLLVYPDTMMANLDQLKGLVHSQRVLLGLTQRGMSREDAYQAVQRNAMDVWLSLIHIRRCRRVLTLTPRWPTKQYNKK